MRLRRASRLIAWYHTLLPETHRWTPEAWARACDYSLALSRERRGCS